MEQKIFVDNYDHLSDDIEYILENILQDDDESEEFKKLKDLYNLSIAKCCECESGRCEDCCHGGNYEMKNGELILKVNRRCQDLIYECNHFCRVTTCHNKVLIFDVFTVEPIWIEAVRIREMKGIPMPCISGNKHAVVFGDGDCFTIKFKCEILDTISFDARRRRPLAKNLGDKLIKIFHFKKRFVIQFLVG